MDYLKSAAPSQIMSERGYNLVVINPGSANIRIGLASQDTPFNIPHCIARYTTQVPKRTVMDQMLNTQITTAQHMEREKAYDVIASLLKMPFLDEESPSNPYSRKMGRIDGLNSQNRGKDLALSWTNVYEEASSSVSELVADTSVNKDDISEALHIQEGRNSMEPDANKPKYRDFICGEEALRISPAEPYCLCRPIRRGHLNISLHYPMQQVLEDLQTIWDWILIEKLRIPHSERNMYAAVLVVPETFDSREIKEMLSLVLKDLGFGLAVVYQEGLAAVFGNGLSTACVVNIGAQVTSIVCIEDGGALPLSGKTLPFGGEDISRCFLWTQRHHQNWPQIRTDILTKPIDMLMLNRLKETYCEIKEGELDAIAVVHSYEDGMPPGSHRTRLTALNVPPMGLFFPTLLVPDVYPPPPRSWFHDYEDMVEDPWHIDFPRRPDMTDTFYSNVNIGLPLWESYPVFSAKREKVENIVGLADAITESILSAGRIDLKRKLFCSIQLAGGVALTSDLVSAMEERVLNAIPPNEAIDTVEVLQSRANPTFMAWKGGAILGVLDCSKEGWIRKEDWINNRFDTGCVRKYKDSYYLQALAMCYVNT